MKASSILIPFRIVIVDDDDFYNKLLTRGIKTKSEQFLMDNGFHLELSSFTHLDDFLEQLPELNAIIFIDYYLDEKQVATKAIKSIKERSPESKIVIISQEMSYSTTVETVLNGAHDFIQKGPQFIEKANEIVVQTASSSNFLTR